jgi:hypothetical protein
MRKTILTVTTILAISISGFAQLTPDVTSWIINPGADTGYSGILSNVQIVQYDTTYTYVSCTCIPGYSIGPWMNNPNTPSNQNFVFKIPHHPMQQTGTKTIVGLGHTGVWTNGVSIFNVSDAMSYNNQGYWNRNAYYWEGPGFDNCLGHPQQQGEYHHHVSPTCLYNQADSTHHSPIIGYAFDGFPVYGAYAYTDTNGTGPIKRMKSSFQLRNITVRDTLPNGTALSSADYGPAISSSYPLGCFIEDYIYVSGSGDLDSSNGRFCKTPEYPNGIYCYFVTIDDSLKPVFPYTYYGNYYGVVTAGDTGPASGHITITDSTHIYNPTGISEINSHIKFTFNPNPVKDYAYIYFDPASSNNIKCSVYDSKGKLVESFNTMQPSISYAFNFSKYANGIYFLHLEANDEQVVQKFVKSK